MEQRIFLAYAPDDESFVQQLNNDLKARGLDITTAQPLFNKSSSSVFSELQKVLDNIDQVLLVISPNSRQNTIVRYAWRYAWQYCKSVVPVLRLEADLELPATLQGIDYVDFRNNRRYEFARDELLAILSVPLAPVGKLNNVPTLPPYFIARDEAVETVKEALFTQNVPVTISAGKEKSPDVGGTGKSLLAVSIAYDCEIRNAAPDGIFWLSLGENPNLTVLQANLYEMVTGTSYPAVDVDLGKNALQEAFKGRSCLLILDDVWDASHVSAFSVMGTQSGLLITTRQPALSDELNALDYTLSLMSNEDAVKLLSLTSGHKIKDMPPSVLDIVKQCGNRPLPLAIAGALVRGNPNGWDDLLGHLRQAQVTSGQIEVDKIAIFKVLQVALQYQSQASTPGLHLQDRYLNLAVLPPQAPITAKMLLKFWNEAQQDSNEEIIKALAERLLIQRDADGNIQIHNVQREYIQYLQEGLHIPHNQLLHAYQTQCDGKGWAHGPNDGYFFEYLIYHLKEAGRHDELRSLLLDYDWIEAKLNATNSTALLADYELALRIPATRASQLRRPTNESSTEDLRLIKTALQLGAEVLAQDKLQLRAQLLGRLLNYDSANIQNLLAYVQKPIDKIWLRPVAASLTEPRTRGRSSLNPIMVRQPLILTHDGQRAIIATRRYTIQVWDLEHGRRELALNGHSNNINALAISSDNKYLVSASDDFSIRVWDLETGTEVRTLRGHTAAVWTVALSPDDKTIVSGSADKTLKVWDFEHGIVRKTLAGHTAEVSDVAFIPDNKHAVSASHDRTLKLWSLDDGAMLRTYKGHSQPINAVTITPDGKTIISGSRDKTIKFWAQETGEEIDTITAHDDAVQALHVSQDGNRLVSAGRDRSLKLWKIQNRKLIRIIAENQNMIMGIAFTPSGEQVVTSSIDEPLRVWNLVTGTAGLSLDPHTQRIQAVDIVPSTADKVITGAWDSSVKLWDVNTGAVLTTFEDHSAGVNTLSLTVDGRYAVSGSWDNQLKVWSLETGNLTFTLKAHIEAISATGITEDRKYLVAASFDNLVTVWDLVTGTRVHSLQAHTAPITALVLTPDSKCAISAALDNTLVLWDIVDGTERHNLKGHTDGINAVCLSTDGQFAYSAGRDSQIIQWDLSSGEIGKKFTGHEGWVNAVAVMPDGQTLVSAGDDGTIRLWDLSGEKEPRIFTGHRHWILHLAIAPDQKYLYSASSDHNLKMWDVATGENVASFTAESPLLTCVVTRDGQSLAIGAQSGKLHLLHIEGVK